jgi:hypothetical protein
MRSPLTLRPQPTQEFEGWLDYSKFALRISAERLEQLPDILKAISDEQIYQLGENLQRVRNRFQYR